ncbi:hypothetical protein FKP32DRAFT_571154 [Trametes sanguinea]|nr:hypothetical protein FKP32DRAFT_571154 [Trametes sanguinea]
MSWRLRTNPSVSYPLMWILKSLTPSILCIGTVSSSCGKNIPHPLSNAHEAIVQVKLQSRRNSSTFNFILAGLRFATSGKLGKHGQKCEHIICALKASSRKPAETDLYQAFLIDCLIPLVNKENWWRDELATSSCMPWSRPSLREFPAAMPSRVAPTLTLDSKAMERLFATGGELAEYNGWTWKYGLPIGIPWFGAPHDSFPFCDTLGEYTAVRSLVKPAQTLHDDAGLWLSAMTFGALEVCTRIHFHESALLVSLGPGLQLTLSGTRILQLLIFWAKTVRRRRSGDNIRIEQGRRVTRVLSRVFDALDQEAGRTTSVLARAGIPEEQRQDVISSVTLAAVAMCIIAQSLWHDLPEMGLVNDILLGKTHQAVRKVVYQWCTRKMQGEGWCPYVLSVAVGSMSLVARVAPILVLLPPFIRTAPNEHARCGTDRCKLDTLSVSKYAPRHTKTNCKCKYVKPPPHAVQQLLSEGTIPVVRFDGRALQVVPAGQTLYVAISHVWLEGMGSTTEDGLPSCVVQRIAGLAKRILPNHGGAFWMDSLCVPQEGSLRKRAIKLMAETYRGAAKVLVIDDCIRAQCSLQKAPEDNLMYIASSAWMRRVWTLQEGMLARGLFFEFKEGPVDFEAEIRTVRNSEGSRLNLPISVVPVFAIREECEDELVAISSLLPPQISTDHLLAEPAGPDVVERRMRVFLRLLREIPRNVPFSSSPRLKLAGFTWAPRMLAKDTTRDWYDGEYGKGVCTEDGLVAEYFVAYLKKGIKVRQLTSTTPPQWGIATLLHHKSSKAAYHLDGLTDDHDRSSTINVLLFLTGDLEAAYTGTSVGRCIAASVVSDGHKAGTSRDSPIRLKYVTSCTHSRQHAIVEALSG